MDEKIENKNKKKSQKKKVLILIILLLLFLVPTMIFWLMNAQEKDSSKVDGFDELESADNAKERGEVNEESTIKDVKQNLSVDEEIIDEKQMVSENYRVSQVKFGGNAVIENGTSRDTKLEIYQVKSENIISQEDNEPRIFISWKTNKEAVSNVSYAKSDGKNLVNIVEEGYGFEHTMLLKNMEFSTIYTYKIEAKDKWGNKVGTEYFSAYTGDESESIFDLITNAVEDVFGWAM